MLTPEGLSNPPRLPRHVFGVVGWKNSGKTTMVVELVRHFTAKGIKVATIKHAHHNVDIDQPGKDSWRHRNAGASAVLLATAKRLMLVEEFRGAPEPPLEDLFKRLPAADLVLVEGFKRDRHPKLEVSRSATGASLLAAEDPSVVALAADYKPEGLDLPTFDLDDIRGVAAFIETYTGLADLDSR